MKVKSPRVRFKEFKKKYKFGLFLNKKAAQNGIKTVNFF